MPPVSINRSIGPFEMVPDGEYETVAASQTAQVMGGSGATGDVLRSILVIPSSTTAGVVTVLDGATSIPVFVGGTLTSDLKPFNIDFGSGLLSVNGPWKVTTGAGLSCVVMGKFT